MAKGYHAAYKIKHANMLLKSDAKGPRWPDTRIADAFGGHPQTVRNLRECFSEGSASRALERWKPAKSPRARRLDGTGEARLISRDPDGPWPGDAYGS